MVLRLHGIRTTIFGNRFCISVCMYVCVCHHEDHHGLLEDCEKTLIYKTDSSDPTRREFFWMYELKNLAPLGLNICEIV